MVQNTYDREKWQLVKRIFVIDTFTGRNKSYQSQLYASDNYFEKYTRLRYIRRIELQFKLHDNHYYFGNRIPVPLLIVEYANVNTRDFRYGSNSDVDFEFRVTFLKNFTTSIFLYVRLRIGFIWVLLSFYDF